MFDTIAGLPLHPLVVHAVEVVVPLAALALVLAAVWPRFRRWAFALPLLLALASLVLVPIATQSGESLEERVGESGAVEVHSHLAESLLPWVVVMTVIAAGLFWTTWREGRGEAAPARGAVPRAVALVLVGASLVVATGTMVQAVRIGHSGATAVWAHTVSSDRTGGDVDDD